MKGGRTRSGTIAVALLFVGTTSAASFDCTKARTKIEKVICSTPALSKADDAMAIAYRKAMATATPNEQNDLKQDQLS